MGRAFPGEGGGKRRGRRGWAARMLSGKRGQGVAQTRTPFRNAGMNEGVFFHAVGVKASWRGLTDHPHSVVPLRSFRFFELPTYADTGTYPAGELCFFSSINPPPVRKDRPLQKPGGVLYRDTSSITETDLFCMNVAPTISPASFFLYLKKRALTDFHVLSDATPPRQQEKLQLLVP